jgi:hypothetical protein
VVSRIGLLALGLALAAMAVDHLLGTEREQGQGGLADATGFALSAILCLVAAAVLFGWVVPRALGAGPERAAIAGVACSALSVVPGIAFAWLGFPFVVAGAGVELGLRARHGSRRRLALAAIVFGTAFLVLGAVAYAVLAAEAISEL